MICSCCWGGPSTTCYYSCVLSGVLPRAWIGWMAPWRRCLNAPCVLGSNPAARLSFCDGGHSLYTLSSDFVVQILVRFRTYSQKQVCLSCRCCTDRPPATLEAVGGLSSESRARSLPSNPIISAVVLAAVATEPPIPLGTALFVSPRQSRVVSHGEMGQQSRL